MNKLLRSKLIIPLAVIIGIAAGMTHWHPIIVSAEVVSAVFINLLKLMSLPIVFLSIVTTAFKFESLDKFKALGARVLKYTLITTMIAATVALCVFVLLNPIATPTEALKAAASSQSYLDYLADLIPSNLVEPFLKGNVISVLLLAALFSYGVMSVSKETREPIKALCNSLFAVVLKLVSGIIFVLPLGVMAFVILFVHEVGQLKEIEHLAIYLAAIISANIIQATIVLPLLLKAKGIAPFKLFKDMLPALNIAFFSKSSAAALPVALECAQNKAKVSPEVAKFSLPLCTTINMNACAAFILITVLFVSMSNGVSFNPLELVAWIFIATIAAVGNASVPMGCYFLSTSLLAALGVPVNMMAIILPVYALIDMLESAINVWSDSCVTAVVDKESATQEAVYPAHSEITEQA